jgi:hypothetical protein
MWRNGISNRQGPSAPSSACMDHRKISQIFHRSVYVPLTVITKFNFCKFDICLTVHHWYK